MQKNDPGLITKEIVIDFIRKHRDSAFFGMVVFGKEAELVESLTNLSELDVSSRFFRGLERIDYRGLYTNTPAAVERALYELKANGRPEADKVIILLTDGIVDTGDKDRDIERENWLKEDLARECQQAGISIFGIAFTDMADFRMIQTLASRTGGAYFRAYTVKDIPGVLSKIEDSFIPAADDPVAPAPVAAPAAAPAGGPVAENLTEPAASKQPATPKPEKGTLSLLPLVLAISIVILGAILLLVTLKRKNGNKSTDSGDTTQRDFSPPPGVDQLHGELIDVENVMQRESPSFLLNAVSVSIGRDSSNNIVIPIDAISSFHATIEYRNGYYHLEDHRSTNGTFLNDGRIKENNPVRLKSGDKINFAIYEFRFLLSDQAPFGETVILQEE
ncbi:MAG: FHA domain-containing protein [Desulfobacterales bacterium]|nr:FHA domain-containing protein [Desulfobacterales bacterium]